MVVPPREKYFRNNGCPICGNELFMDDEKIFFSLKKLTILTNPIWYIRGFWTIGQAIYYDKSSAYKTFKEYLYCKNCGNYFFCCPICGEIDKHGTEAPYNNLLIKKECNNCHQTYVYHPWAGLKIDDDRIGYPIT